MDLKENRITVRELLATVAAREVLRRDCLLYTSWAVCMSATSW